MPVLYQDDWADRAGFWHGGFLPAILRYFTRKFFRSSKNKGTSKISSLQVDHVVMLLTKLMSTVELVDLNCDSRCIVAVYYMTIDRNVLTTLLRFMWIVLYNLFLQLFSI